MWSSFIAPEKTQENNAIVAALHRAVVEVQLLKELGLPLISLSHLPSLDELDWTSRVKIKPAADGSVTLEFPTSREREDYVSVIREAINRAVAMAETEATEEEERTREGKMRRRGQKQEQDEVMLAGEEAQQAQNFEPDTAAAVEAEAKATFQDEDIAVLEGQADIQNVPAAKAYALSKEEFSNLRQVSLVDLPTRFAVSFFQLAFSTTD